MRNGTQGFVPERLEQARKVMGLTQTTLAQRIKVSPASISKWENGSQTPEPRTLSELGLALGVGNHFFLRPLPNYGNAPLFYRSMAAANVTPRERMAVKLRWLQDIALGVSEHIEYPELNLPKFNYLPKEFYSIQDTDIEQAALDCRKFWGLGEGPIADMLLTLENAGVVVGVDEVGNQHLDGVSTWLAEDKRPYILLATDKQAAVRSRFDAAHELGHLILHRYTKVNFEDRSPEYLEVERQAHLFANAFLLPQKQFLSELYAPTLDAMLALKKRWKVSIGAMLKRCESLDTLSSELKTRLWKYHSIKGWRKSEPFDDEIVIERPRLLAKSIELLLNEKVLKSEELVHNLSLPTRDIEKLASLPAGFFQESQDSSIVIEPKLAAWGKK